MLKLHKINPMVRALGTVGVVVALVGGVTYAATFNSNQVKLTDNTMATPAPGLAIASINANSCPEFGDGAWTTSSVPGMNITDLTGTSTFKFCIENNSSAGSGPESITMTSPGITTTGLSQSDVTLTVVCGNGTAAGGTLDAFSGSDNFVVDSSIAQGAVDKCTATATLNPSYSGSGGTVNSFELDFLGTVTSAV